MKDGSLSKRRKNDIMWGYLMIIPLVAGLAVFYFYPFFKVIIDSFFEVGAFNKRKWVGIANYQTLVQDKVMWRSLFNTLRYVIVIVPLNLACSLLMAVMLNTKIKGRSLFRVIYFLPAVTMGAAIAMIWKWIFNGDYGIVNYILGLFGMDPVQWITNPKLAWIIISIVSVWSTVGYNLIILLAGIQGISGSYYESASLDGASEVAKFRYITLPLVTPTLFFVLITTLIGTFQTFDVIYMMLSAKSLAIESAQSVVVYFYRNAFEFSKKGYASAIAIILFLIIMLVTLFQMKIQKKWVNYD